MSEITFIPSGTTTPITFGTGESISVFNPDPGFQSINVLKGTAAAPDTTYAPLIHVSRTINVAEASFGGDGAPGLTGIYAVTKAVAASQGQAIGIYGGAITESTNVGAHSQTDAVGGYFVGKSTPASTRAGIGLFTSGRRENVAGITTGIEVSSDNSTAAAGVFEPKGASTTKGIWLHATGESNSGVGLQIGKPFAVNFEVGIGVNEGAVGAASFRDDSQSTRSILVRGAHEKASVAVAANAGPVIIGAEEISEPGSLLQVFSTAGTFDPLVTFGSGQGSAFSVIFRNGTGNMKHFVANGANNFLSGTVQGDTGIAFTPTKTFHIGPQTKAAMIKVQETGLGFYGVAPVAQHATITAPAETLASLKEKVEQLTDAVKKIGIIA